MSGLVLLLVLVVAVLLIALLACRLRPLRITLTVRAGRQVTIGGRAFPEGGPADEGRSFVVPAELTTRRGDEIALSVEPVAGAGEGAIEVSMARGKLRSLHVDAALPTGLTIYGCYDDAMSPWTRTTKYAMATKCIDCDDGVRVCAPRASCN